MQLLRQTLLPGAMYPAFIIQVVNVIPIGRF